MYLQPWKCTDTIKAFMHSNFLLWYGMVWHIPVSCINYYFIHLEMELPSGMVFIKF